MEKSEFFFQITRLGLAFEKSLKDDLLDLWWEELRSFSLREIQAGVKYFLETDQKVFPKLGEFKSAIRGKERRTPEGGHSELPSCSRCSHGFCSVYRWIGQNRYSYTFRCSCPSGESYPGLPLVSPSEETFKERARRGGIKTSQRTLKLPQAMEFPIFDNEEIPF